MTIEFIEARITELEQKLAETREPDTLHEQPKTFYDFLGEYRDDWGVYSFNVPRDQLERQCAAYRQILDLHKGWPVLVESPPTFEGPTPALGDVNAMTFRMTQQLAWTTEQAYRDRFGTEPPTAPIIRALASLWSDHPDYPFREAEDGES